MGFFMGNSAVFCNLKPKRIHLLHNNFQSFMGACLSNQSKYQQKSPNSTPTQLKQLRSEILKQLNYSSLSPTSANLESKQPDSAADAKSAKSLKHCGEETDQGEKESLRNCNSKNQSKQQHLGNKIDLKKENKDSADEVAQTTSENQTESVSVSNDGTIQSQISIENVSEDQIEMETPESRVHKIISSQVGNGLTQADNKLIALSLDVDVPTRLSEVRLLNGSRYEGEWLQGKREGEGTVRWGDGSTYTGEWHNNCSHGKGKLTFANGAVYEGGFLQNKAEGSGIFTYADGSKYEGEWKNNQREGKGILEWIDGERYEGGWTANKKQGYGQLHFRDGSFYRGEFNANEIHGQGFYFWHNSREYEGEWEHNQLSGLGKLKWNNGQQYEGRFANSKYHGEGTLTLKDGSSSTGNWEKGRKNGMFDEKDIAGRITHVEWHFGKRYRQPQDKKRAKDERTLSSLTHSF